MTWSKRCRGARRGQGGFTLMEMLITVAISSVIMVPLLAWMTLGFQTQVQVTHNSARTAARNLLVAYLPRDVGAAAGVDPSAPADCAPTPTAGPIGPDRFVLALTGAGTAPVRTVYLVRQVDSRSGVLIRRVCSGASIDDTQLVEDVALPISSSVIAKCEGLCNARSGRVDLTVSLIDGEGTVDVTASRRLGADT